MRRPSDALQRFAKATAPSEEAVRRVLDAVHAEVDEAQVHVLPISEGGPRSPGLRRSAIGAAGVAAVGLMAAAALLTVPRVPWSTERDPVLLADDTITEELAPGVTATYRGQGRIQRGEPLLVDWDQGGIGLSVLHEAELPVVVRTPEAEAKVVGTLFSVTRDALGTRVDVSFGTVAVTCSGNDVVALNASDSRLCMPTTALGLLGRAKALRERGSTTEQVLETIEAGLTLARDAAAEGELHALRIRHLLDVGRPDEAFPFVDDYLERGFTLRRSQMLRVFAELTSDCEARRDALAQIPADERTVDDATLLEDCPQP